MARAETIRLAQAAPDKPDFGAACNGCGICCALETCPLGRLRFLRAAGPCPGLRWEETSARYFCRLAESSGGWWRRLAARLAARWIAAGAGCDMAAVIEAD